MIHFNYTSEETLSIRITEDFGHPDTERIALVLEGSFEDYFDKTITFHIESDLPKKQMALLDNFCQQLPYRSQIDLKYPILDWTAY